MMIDSDYLRTMARYNRWQNRSIFAAANTLPDAERRRDRGAFWHSIHGTLSHIYWADRIWLSRVDLTDPPDVGQKQSAAFVEDWNALCEKRQTLDALLIDWCDSRDPDSVEGKLRWYSGSAGREVEAPLGVIMTHFFNHQTHHRGHVHAMVTAAGATPEDTDLFLMPRDDWPG